MLVIVAITTSVITKHCPFCPAKWERTWKQCSGSVHGPRRERQSFSLSSEVAVLVSKWRGFASPDDGLPEETAVAEVDLELTWVQRCPGPPIVNVFGVIVFALSLRSVTPPRSSSYTWTQVMAQYWQANTLYNMAETFLQFVERMDSVCMTKVAVYRVYAILILRELCLFSKDTVVSS